MNDGILEHKRNYGILTGRAASIMFASLVLACSAASAQNYTDDELREINADAASTIQFIDRTDTRGGLTCEPGLEPTQFYFSDFEADDGGWSSTGFGDWEWGEVVPDVDAGCDTAGAAEPDGAFSGDNAWATVLDGCYTNSGDTSTLTQTFDFSGLSAPIELSSWQWLHVFGPFDFAELVVNGDQLFLEEGATASSDYSLQAIDLSAYAGEPAVTIELSVFATTVVNRAGWYVDDVAITSCQGGGGPLPDTQAVPALSVGGLIAAIMALLLVGLVVLRIRA